MDFSQYDPQILDFINIQSSIVVQNKDHLIEKIEQWCNDINIYPVRHLLMYNYITFWDIVKYR